MNKLIISTTSTKEVSRNMEEAIVKINQGAEASKGANMKYNNQEVFEHFSQEVLKKGIITLSRVRDPLRRCPEAMIPMITGQDSVWLGRGKETKYGKGLLSSQNMGSLVFWTKGPVTNLRDIVPLYNVLQDLIKHECLIGLELTVTGLGGTFIEPGIPYWKDTVKQLQEILTHTPQIIDQDAVIVRYDPVLKIQTEDGRIITNINIDFFETIVQEFTKLGISKFTTKPLLTAVDGYKQVNRQFDIVKCKAIPITPQEFNVFYTQMQNITAKYNTRIIWCCNSLDKERTGCIDGATFLQAGKKLFGDDWDRISLQPRPCRPDCKCIYWYDIGNNEGIPKCITSKAGCVYCSLSGVCPDSELGQTIKSEYEAFLQVPSSCYKDVLIEEKRRIS